MNCRVISMVLHRAETKKSGVHSHSRLLSNRSDQFDVVGCNTDVTSLLSGTCGCGPSPLAWHIRVHLFLFVFFSLVFKISSYSDVKCCRS